MSRCERAMSARMPVLRQDDMFETPRQCVDGRDDLVAARNREAAAGAEVVLQVDDEKKVVRADFDAGRAIVGFVMPWCGRRAPSH